MYGDGNATLRTIHGKSASRCPRFRLTLTTTTRSVRRRSFFQRVATRYEAPATTFTARMIGHCAVKTETPARTTYCPTVTTSTRRRRSSSHGQRAQTSTRMPAVRIAAKTTSLHRAGGGGGAWDGDDDESGGAASPTVAPETRPGDRPRATIAQSGLKTTG